MYTRCPHCTTIFRVTAEELRTTYGDIPCVTCAQPFNALDTLADDITTLIAAPVVNTEMTDAVETTETEEERADSADVTQDEDEDTQRQPKPDLSAISPEDQADDGRNDDEPEDDTCPDEEQGKATDERAAADDTQADSGNAEQPDDQPADDFEANTPIISADKKPPDSMEFDAPEQTWTRFFISTDTEDNHREPTFQANPDHTASAPEHPVDDTSGDLSWASSTDDGSFEIQTADHDEWQKFLTEIDKNESSALIDDEEETERNSTLDGSDESDYIEPAPVESLTDVITTDAPASEVETPIIPPWLADEMADNTPQEQGHGFRPAWAMLGICMALGLLLTGQLLHYNRDALAVHKSYGPAIRQAYDLLGAALYPDWSLDAFEVTGTEAITGRSNQNALDILANVIVNGQQPVGLPLIRIVLRDRWANPVATRVFTADEYLRDFNAAQPSLVKPGTALAVEISVADPGAEALSYVVDVCLPRRKTGLECQIAKDPFQ